jgi:hypothetical protein
MLRGDSLFDAVVAVVVRVALRQHVPLRACVENPQHAPKCISRLLPGHDSFAMVPAACGRQICGNVVPSTSTMSCQCALARRAGETDEKLEGD